jgi:subtilisin family serine protease
MGNSLRIKTLASAVGLALIGAAGAPAMMVATSGTVQAATQDTASAREVYIIRFAEPGLLHYAGGTQGLRATNPANGHKLDVHTPQAEAYKGFLQSQRDSHLQAISQAIGRSLDVTHTYLITMNGVAAELSAAEAASIARVPGIESVRPAGEAHTTTYHGPEFIHADTIWDGSGVPGGVGTRGQGVVVGVIDTGANSTHPSFADDPTCGVFGPDNHKLLSAVDCTATDGSGACAGPNPEANPTFGHGVHTASTAAGNTIDGTVDPPPSIPAPFTTMSGVAPCASLRTYKVCASNNCSGAAIEAGIEGAIADGVDVINFSISGGTSPWNDSDRSFLDAVGADVFVAASAGNTGTGITNPVGAVNHLGPWMTTVAASTHDLNAAGTGLLSATGPGSPPGNTQNIALTPGSGTDTGTAMTNVDIRHYAANELGCTDSGGFPPDYFDGAVALIQRGTCTFEEKINNAQAAGAVVAIISNNAAGIINMSVGAASLPAYSIQQSEGAALVTFIDASAPTPTTVDFTPAIQQGDVIAGFSLRGPSALASVTKPDITGPGVNIYAAMDPGSANYGYLSGTSMSSPHTAGSGALLRAAHPDWTPAEVKSALMLTASTTGTEEDLTTPWTPDDVGSGRIDLSKAAKVGFVMNETYDNFVAANPSSGGDPMTLNIPSARNLACNGSCSWTRELRNTLGAGPSWTVTVNAPDGLDVTVEPSSFTFNGGDRVFGDGFDGTILPPMPEFQTLTITATPTAPLSDIAFAEIVFHEANGLAPDAHIFVAVEGNP